MHAVNATKTTQLTRAHVIQCASHAARAHRQTVQMSVTPAGAVRTLILGMAVMTNANHATNAIPVETRIARLPALRATIASLTQGIFFVKPAKPIQEKHVIVCAKSRSARKASFLTRVVVFAALKNKEGVTCSVVRERF